MARQASKSPQQVAQKWTQNLSASTQSIQAGVQGVTVSPTQLAAANPEGYLAGIQRAVSSGKWQNKLQAVSLQQWQQAMVTKGIPRIQTGAQAGQPKMLAFMQNFLPYVQQAKQQLASTPRGSLAQNQQRMIQWSNLMSQYKQGG